MSRAESFRSRFEAPDRDGTPPPPTRLARAALVAAWACAAWVGAWVCVAAPCPGGAPGGMSGRKETESEIANYKRAASGHVYFSDQSSPNPGVRGSAIHLAKRAARRATDRDFHRHRVHDAGHVAPLTGCPPWRFLTIRGRRTTSQPRARRRRAQRTGRMSSAVPATLSGPSENTCTRRWSHWS